MAFARQSVGALESDKVFLMRARLIAATLVLGVDLVPGAVGGRIVLAEDTRSISGAEWAASHFPIQDPARIGDDKAASLYRELIDDMLGLYKLSREPHVDDYTRWPRYVTAPYLTAAHGNRYHTIYARSAERRYGRYEQAGGMPAGTVVAKDSFSVSSDGRVHPGPLSMMEKLTPGSSPETGDWRFTEIMPDGSVYGSSTGPLKENVAHCVACHRSVATTQDWLYFPPPAYRVAPTP